LVFADRIAALLQIFRDFSFGTIAYALVIILLLFLSGLFSSSEVAFFSLNPSQLKQIRKSSSSADQLIKLLLSNPKRLLATLLISNSIVNIAIIILSSVLIAEILDFSNHPTAGFIIQVIVVTFMIVLLGEVMPKIYATYRTMPMAHFVAYPVYFSDRLLRPVSFLILKWTALVEKRIRRKGYEVTMDQLTHAIDIASDASTPPDEKRILKGIVRFSGTEARQIMKPRVDVIAFDSGVAFSELLRKAEEAGFSRVPVYEKNPDRIKGILYIKDLIPHLDKDDSFSWQHLIRKPYFIPESKKINELLEDFQNKKMHFALVVDEYGVLQGIVSLEDILEEIVGEISDEFDDEEPLYSRLDDRNFVFDAKAPLDEVCRIMKIDSSDFNDNANEKLSLAGFVLGLAGRIPRNGEVFYLSKIILTIESADKQRIRRVKISKTNAPRN